MSQNSKPILAYDNQVPAATVSASTEDTDYPKENVQDLRAVTWWKGTGSSEQYLQADLGQGALGDTFADLSSWTETDPNSTLQATGGALSYDSGSNANDNPNITWTASITVATLFALELVFDVTAWATASAQEAYIEMEFASNYKVRFKIDNNGGTPRVTFQHDADAGSWTDVNNYTLSGGTSGRIKMVREADGDVLGYVYDDNDSTYHSLGTYVGGSNYQTTGPATLKIEFNLSARTAGSFTVSCATLYHADASGVTAFGISGHDLYTQGAANVRLDASVGGVGWSTVVAAFTPTDDKTFLKFLTDGPYRYYRLVIPTGYSSPPGIGVFYLGGYLQFPTWVSGDFDPDRRRVVYEENRSMTGQLVGTSIQYQDREIDLKFDRLTLTWAETNLINDFWETALGKPLFFAWDVTNHADEVYYLLFGPKELSAPMRAASRYTRFTLRGPHE